VGQARAVKKIENNVLTIDSPFACELDETTEFNFGGTLRKHFYVVNNRTFDAGHLQFYPDQCYSIFDGNEIYKAGGLMLFGWRGPRNRFKPLPGDESATLDYFTYQTHLFISFVNNKLLGGNHFHFFGATCDKHSELIGGIDFDWLSRFSVIGALLNGTGTSIHGALYRNNELNDNSIFKYHGVGAVENAIFERNTIKNSDYAFNFDCYVKNSYIRNNTFDTVDTPYCIKHINEAETSILIEE